MAISVAAISSTSCEEIDCSVPSPWRRNKRRALMLYQICINREGRKIKQAAWIPLLSHGSFCAILFFLFMM
jgi:hypothetical protein